MDRKLVSFVTGTWQRHDLLVELIENVRAQTYRPLEHVIVSDGPDPELRDLVARNLNLHAHDNMKQPERYVPIVFCELGRQWSEFLGPDSISASPFKVAQFLAHGDYQCWAADDESFTPDHVERLIDIIEDLGVDFAYSQSRCWRPGQSPDGGMVIGRNPPAHGHITQATYRVEMLKHRMFELHVGSGTDWDQVKHWMAAGASWAFLREVTHTHRIDK